MGKIFGISDLPVTIFTTPLEQPKVPEPLNSFPRRILGESALKRDLFVVKNKTYGFGFLNRIINGLRIGAK